MCGIAGIVSRQEVPQRLYRALLNLEYRGYDSCGLAVINDGRIECRKNVGKIAEVNRKERFEEMRGVTGIAHTRWATTGAVTTPNSHPHLSNGNKLALVHNGIISNYVSLRDGLLKKGYHFRSETDT